MVDMPAATPNPVPEVKPEAPVVDPKAIDPTKPTAKDPENPTQAEKSALKIWKLKQNGKEVEYDATDEEKVKQDIQKVFGIEEKAALSAQDRKLAEGFFNLAKSGDFSWLNKLMPGATEAEKEAAAVKMLSEYMVKKAIADDEEKRLTPEQKELREFRRREAARQQEEEEKAKELTKKQQEELADKFGKEILNDINIAAKEAGYPENNKAVIKFAAEYLQKGWREGIKLTPKDVMPIVVKELEALDNARFESYDGEKLVKWLGKHIDKVRKYDLDLVKSNLGKKTQPKKEAQKKSDTKQEPNKNSFKEMIKESRRNWDEA
jgi:hypothetical protein